MNGKPDILPGEFWRLVGRLVPGDVDHVMMYVGPGGRCIEAGSRGVIAFDMPDSKSTIDVPITDDQKPKIEEGKEVSYLSVMGRTKLDVR